MSETETRNPDQNPSPTESEESEEDCVVCEMYPVDDEPTKTSNRALFNVNNRYYIDPMCEEHDTEDAASAVQNAYDYAGVSFVVEAVQQGVFSREDALEHLPEAEHQAIESAL